MNNQIFFIQIDGNKHVSNITHDNHINDNGWYEVIVDPAHLSAFQNHYTEVMYDTDAQALVYPEDFAADAAITNDNKGIVKNLQDQINENKNNILNNSVQVLFRQDYNLNNFTSSGEYVCDNGVSNHNALNAPQGANSGWWYLKVIRNPAGIYQIYWGMSDSTIYKRCANHVPLTSNDKWSAL